MFYGSYFRMCLWETNASAANSRFRVPRIVEEAESALVSEARPSSKRYKVKWAVEIFREDKGRKN